LFRRSNFLFFLQYSNPAPKNINEVTHSWIYLQTWIRIAPRPDQMLPKSIAHSSVIADVVVRKFVDGFLTNAFALLCAFIPGSTLNLVQLTHQCHHLMSRSRVLAAVRRLDNR